MATNKRKTPIVVGTRGSLLALAQSNLVLRKLKKRWPKHAFQIEIIKTRGDQDQSHSIWKKNSIGVFTSELEKALKKRQIDIAIHSLKDLPTTLDSKLALGAFPKRENPNDVLVTKNNRSIETLRKNAKVGTTSLRRKEQLRRLRPDLIILPLRGNLNTRLKKVSRGQVDAVVIAKAGLMRLGAPFNRLGAVLPTDRMIPCAGQGILGIQIRKSDLLMKKITLKLNHAPTQAAAWAERECLKALKGGCRVPVGIHACIRNQTLFIEAAVFSVKSDDLIHGKMAGKPKDAKRIGYLLAKDLLNLGAGKLLHESRNIT
jgi:hydroxymethylbilane synthase